MTDAEFREAYGQHKDMLHRFAWRMTGSAAAAEDLVQDCFLPAMAKLDRARPGARDHAQLPGRRNAEPCAQTAALGSALRRIGGRKNGIRPHRSRGPGG